MRGIWRSARRQIIGAIAVKCRGIGHGLVEPLGVESVAEIIVGGDVLPRLGAGVGAQPVTDLLDQAHHTPRAASQAVADFDIDQKQFEKSGHVRTFPITGHVGFGDPYGAVGQRADAPGSSCAGSVAASGPSERPSIRTMPGRRACGWTIGRVRMCIRPRKAIFALAGNPAKIG
jgi:hypothetical protein